MSFGFLLLQDHYCMVLAINDPSGVLGGFSFKPARKQSLEPPKFPAAGRIVHAVPDE